MRQFRKIRCLDYVVYRCVILYIHFIARILTFIQGLFLILQLLGDSIMISLDLSIYFNLRKFDKQFCWVLQSLVCFTGLWKGYFLLFCCAKRVVTWFPDFRVPSECSLPLTVYFNYGVRRTNINLNPLGKLV